MSRRDQIRMTQDEIVAFLGEEKTLTLATIGRDGWPHLMPLWYVLRPAAEKGFARPDFAGARPEKDFARPDFAGALWGWTYASSQKVRNLERDPRGTIQVEAGTEYGELRGVMFKTEVEVIRDTDRVADLGLDIFRRYSAGDQARPSELADEVRAMVLKQAEKRVAMRFAETERATWDHRKLATGVY